MRGKSSVMIAKNIFRKGEKMNHFRHFMKPALLVLLVLCTLLTSCFNNGTANTETTGTQHEHTTTTPTEEGTNPPDTPTACTHATTTLVGAKQPTCAEEGFTGNKVCNACTEIVEQGTAIAKLAHTWDNGTITKQPTCISTGVTTITCTGCGESKTETIATVPHNDVYHDALDGTHNHTCTTCTMNENKVHTPVEGSEVVHAATCLEDAYKEYTCSDCNGVYKVYGTTAADKATGHSWSKWNTTAANCTETGLKTRDCACGAHEEVEIPVNVNNHAWKETERNAATCTEDGGITYTCQHCQATNTQTLTATGVHSYRELESRGDGWTTQECTVCQHQTSKFDAANVVQAEVKADKIPDDTAFEVSMEKASIEFPKEVVSQLKENADADVSIGADVVADKNDLISNATNLTEEQKARLENVDVYDFSVKVNDAPVAGFDASVMVTMPYTLKADEDPDGVIIWYVANDGTIEEIAATYNTETGMVSFSVEHFSFYAVAYKETQEMQCRRGNHDYQPTTEKYDANCESFGYTVYKCSCCNASTIDDIVEKQDHAYGAIIPAEPTCDEGDYETRVCANCNHELLVKYVRALGHTLDGVATCTTPSTCTTCKQVVTPALGHNWTEWTVVVEPTEINSGLRRRHCPACGEVEEVRLAATGNIKPLSFSSYQEMLELIFAEAFNLGNGSLTATYSMNGVTYTVNAKVNEENNSYLMLIDLTETVALEDGTTRSATISAFYRNGVFAYARSNQTETWVEISDLPTYFALPFDVYMEYAKQTFEALDPMAAAYLAQARELLAHYSEICGEEINAALAAAGAEYTVEDLSKILDSFETVYAYAALKLGYQPSLSLKDGVEIPTKNDLLTVLSAFMTPTQGEGRTDYAWNIEPLMTSINGVIGWFEAHNEMALSEVFYEIFGADIVATYPELTDWEACVSYIRQQFPGTMTIKDAVDLLISTLETNEICTMAELYEIIDTIALEATGNEFDCEAFVAENGSLTLDDLVAAMFEDEDATLEAFYKQMNEMLTTVTLGETAITLQGEPVEIAELTAMLKQYLTVLDVDMDLSFAVDANGNLISIKLDEKLDMLQPGETESSEPIRVTFENISVEVKIDDSVKVEIPAVFQPIANDRVTASYDNAGNLVISGLNGTFETTIAIEGYNTFNIGDLLKKDDTMSAELGYDVYAFDKSFWSSSNMTENLIKVGDKYYEYHTEYVDGYDEVAKTIVWADILNDPTLILPEEGTEPYAYYNYVDEFGTEFRTPVYSTVLGYVYQTANGWEYALMYNTYGNGYYDKEKDKYVYETIFEVMQSVTLEELMQNIRISSISNNDYAKPILYNGVEIRLGEVIVDFGIEDYFSNAYLDGYVDGNDIVLVQTNWHSGYNQYVLDAEVTTLPNHDWQSNSSMAGNKIVDANGNEVTASISMVYFYAYVPTYYVKVNNTTFATLYNVKEGIYVEDLEKISLPDGNEMYVLGNEPWSGETLVYGFVEIADGVFVQTVCRYQGETLVDVRYREARTDYHASYSQMYRIEDYVTKNADGSYTIKAELIAKLKSHCTEEGDSYAFDIRASYEANGTTYDAFYTVGAYMIPEQIEIGYGGSHGDAEKDFSWDHLFGEHDQAMYETVINDDGSLTIFFRNGKKINVSYQLGWEIPAEGFLTDNEQKFEETGLNIYDRVTSYTSGSNYVFKDGKYYHYSYIPVYDLATVESYAELITNGWYFSEFSYRYDFKDKTTGEILPVYDANVCFFNSDKYSFYPNAISVFFVVKEGQLYALTQAEENGESVLQFEGMMPADEYFASLTVEYGTENSYSSTVYYNGALIPVNSVTLYLYENDENGTPITDENGEKIAKYSTTVYFITIDGQKQYVSEFDYLNDTYLKVGEEAQVNTSGYTVTYNDSKYINGTFNFAYVSKVYSNTQHYVMLAGRCYYYNNVYYSYQNQKITEDDFNSEAAELLWAYMAVDPATGATKYYGKIDFDYDSNGDAFVVLTEELAEAPNYTDCESYQFDEKTADGWTVWEISYYEISEEEWTITELDDGTVFYEKDGEGYLKGQDGYYVYARRIYDWDTDESYIVCELDRAYLDTDDIKQMGIMDEYFVLNDAKTMLTISKDLLDLIPEECRDDFYIYINTGYGDEEISYYELEGLFMLN